MSKKISPRDHTLETQLVHGPADSKAWQFSQHLIPPITSNTTFRLGSLARGAQGFEEFGAGKKIAKDQAKHPILVYDRLDEPNTMMLEEQIATLEGTDCCVTFGSGMGAISGTLLSVLKAGDEIVANKTLYGCTHSLLSDWLPKFGIKTHFVDINSPTDRKAIQRAQVRVIYFEISSNPNLILADIARIVADVKVENLKRAARERVLIIVDNTFATPWAHRPMEWGADFSIESLTKNISGFGVEMGGAVSCRKEHRLGLKLARKDFGAIINPKAAWHISVHGIPTLAIRYAKQQENALAVAKFLESLPEVESVVYPGLKSHPQYELAKKILKTPAGDFAPGTMISFTLKGDMKNCARFVDKVAKESYSITLAVSLGLTKTLIEVPGYMTHSGIPQDQRAFSAIDPRMIRLSLGIENVTDIIADLKNGLSQKK
jgi:methionine-gamma-lyase